MPKSHFNGFGSFTIRPYNLQDYGCHVIIGGFRYFTSNPFPPSGLKGAKNAFNKHLLLLFVQTSRKNKGFHTNVGHFQFSTCHHIPNFTSSRSPIYMIRMDLHDIRNVKIRISDLENCGSDQKISLSPSPLGVRSKNCIRSITIRISDNNLFLFLLLLRAIPFPSIPVEVLMLDLCGIGNVTILVIVPNCTQVL